MRQHLGGGGRRLRQRQVLARPGHQIFLIDAAQDEEQLRTGVEPGTGAVEGRRGMLALSAQSGQLHLSLISLGSRQSPLPCRDANRLSRMSCGMGGWRRARKPLSCGLRSAAASRPTQDYLGFGNARSVNAHVLIIAASRVQAGLRMSKLPPPDAAAPPAAGGLTAAAAGATAPFALVIDDEEPICRLIAGALAQLGIESATFPTAKPAIAALDERWPSIIFLDVALSQSDAIDVIKGLSEKHYDGVVQLMSGAKPYLLAAIDRIAVRYAVKLLPALHKPVVDAMIREAVARAGLDLTFPRPAAPEC
jgi:ActR/RegA family two-component response regulator